MCRRIKNEKGTLVNQTVLVDALTPTGRESVSVDRCLSPLIMALADAGVITLFCCCGHGEVDMCNRYVVFNCRKSRVEEVCDLVLKHKPEWRAGRLCVYQRSYKGQRR